MFISTFIDNIHDAEENDPLTKTQQLVYAQLALSLQTSTINHSPSSRLKLPSEYTHIDVNRTNAYLECRKL